MRERPDGVKSISFHFHPQGFDEGHHVVAKAEDSGKRYYLEGVASGPKPDEHGERMTEKCIKSFMDQANSGDILLYADMHGFKATEDIGILKAAEILQDGDWHISSMLYNESDGVDDRAVQVANKLMKQILGQPPYSKPKQKGFSIEGFVPDSGILQMDSSGRRVLDDVQLDGVVVVPRPAYKDSIAHAIYKALDEVAPWVVDDFQTSIRGKLREKLVEDELKDTYFRRKYQIEDVFEQQLSQIMCADLPDKRQMLEIAFDEYKDLMVDLVLQSEALFQFTPEEMNETERLAASRKDLLLSSIKKTLGELEDLRHRRES